MELGKIEFITSKDLRFSIVGFIFSEKFMSKLLLLLLAIDTIEAGSCEYISIAEERFEYCSPLEAS